MIRIAITNLGLYNEGELSYKWLELPYDDESLQEALDEIGIDDEYEEWFITDYETDIPGLKIHEYENLDNLNSLAEKLEYELDENDKDILEGLIEWGFFSSWDEAVDSVDQFILIPSVKSDKEVGHYILDGNNSLNDLDEDIARYIDYEEYGHDFLVNDQSTIVEGGWLRYIG